MYKLTYLTYTIKNGVRIFLLLLSFLSIQASVFACGFNFVSDGSAKIRLVKNTATADYFVSYASFGASLNNANLGTGLTTLALTYGEGRTWESCSNMVLETNVMYRIYTNPLDKGTFQSVGLTDMVLFTNPPYRTRTRTGNFNTDLLAGLLSNTTYSLEVVMQLKIDTDGNGTADQTFLSDKDQNGNPVSYVATFQTGVLSVVPTGFPVTLTPQNVTCRGGNNGSITAVPTGGTAPFTYLWSNNATSATTTGLVAGSYSVTVTDATAATGIRSVSVSDGATVSAAIAVTNAACAQTNGSAIATPSGGTAPYTYVWSNAATTASISSLASGNISLTVRDANNCTGTASATIGENCGGGGTYCTSSATTPWLEWLSRVKLGTIDNTSSKSPYTDYTALRTNLNAGGSYSITLSSDFSYTTSNYGWKVWIDYNKNGVFDEPTEVAFSRIARPTLPNGTYSITGTIVVPTSAVVGVTRMRVAIQRDSLSQPCAAIPFGEVEDYSVNIVNNGGSTCNILADATNITCNNNATQTNPVDDTYTFSINVTGTGTKWQTTINGTIYKGLMNTPRLLGPFLISAGSLNFTVRDSVDATCTFAMSVDAPQPCSTGGTPPGTYCAAQGTTPWFDWISNVKFGSINNPSVKTNYSNFTSQSAVVFKGASVPIRITSGFGYLTPAKMCTAWIDYNRDGTFDASELAFSGSTGATLRGDTASAAGNITIPLTATEGSTRMRIALKRGTTAATPCETIVNGEVEDYNVVIATPVLPLIGRTGTVQQDVLEMVASSDISTVNVMWASNTARKNALFILEKSADNVHFEDIYEVEAFQATDELTTFNYIDKSPYENQNYYRLRLIYIDKSAVTSQAIMVKFDVKPDFDIYPNPSTEGVTVDLKNWSDQALNLDILNNIGMPVYHQHFADNHARIEQIDVNSLPNGSYFMRLTAPNRKAMIQKLIVLR